jgi:hypothetical protein
MARCHSCRICKPRTVPSRSPFTLKTIKQLRMSSSGVSRRLLHRSAPTPFEKHMLSHHTDGLSMLNIPGVYHSATASVIILLAHHGATKLQTASNVECLPIHIRVCCLWCNCPSLRRPMPANAIMPEATPAPCWCGLCWVSGGDNHVPG